MKKRLVSLFIAAAVSASALVSIYAEDEQAYPAGDLEERIVYETEDTGDTDFEVVPDPVMPMRLDRSIFDQNGGDYAYNDFLKRSNPEGRRNLYDYLLTLSRNFMNSSQNIPPTQVNYSDGTSAIIYQLDLINIDSYGIEPVEAVEVYYMFRNDHPEYYWLSNSIGTVIRTTGSQVTNLLRISVYDDYAAGAERARLNAAMEETAEDLITSVKDCYSRYDIAKTLHDEIAAMVDYGYDSDGNALDTAYAHNIVAVLDGDDTTMPVCEGYAKAYQLLLNYLDIENIVVTGDVNGGGHMWNAVQMENGNYYQVDITWDDQPSRPGGIVYTYFMSALSNWRGRYYDSYKSTGIYFQYELPDFPSEAYDPSTAPTPIPTEQPMKPTDTPKPTGTPEPTIEPTPSPTAEPVSEVEVIGAYKGRITVDKLIYENEELPMVFFFVSGAEDEVLSEMKLMLAEYDSNGKLISLSIGLSEIAAEDVDEHTAVFAVGLPESDRFKYMLWDNNNIPLIRAINTLK